MLIKAEPRRTLLALLFGSLALATPLIAHHGSATSYDTANMWKTKATVVEFKYANPHPFLSFERTNEKGEVEHWDSELATNPTFLIRAGWPKTRSEAALKPGTVVELTLATSFAGTHHAIIQSIRNEQGERIVSSAPGQ